MTSHIVSTQQARLIQLQAQGLLQRPTQRATRQSLLAAIRRMHLLQIDTIHVVNRSPYLVLFARIGAFPLEWLEQALAQAELIECWAHEACFAPAEDFPLHRAHQRSRRHWSQRIADRSREIHADEIAALVERVRVHGAVRASDFQREESAPASGGWWGWKPEKRWLETAFASGELLIARRERFQRIYDVPERVLAGRPELLGAVDPTPEVLRRHCILAAARALGICKARWLADYFRLDRRVNDAELAPMLAAGELLPVTVTGWDEPAYLHPEHAGWLDSPTLPSANYSCLLSPFDPLVWDRERALSLFDFDYRLECYTPAPKRRFGYFVLPILDCGRLIGRLDGKAHRAEGVFEIKALFLEAGVRPGAGLATRLVKAIGRFADWHGTPQLQFGEIEPPALRPLLESAIIHG